jgi:hypothetical protein
LLREKRYWKPAIDCMEDNNMGEILGLGMSHALGMRPPAPKSGAYRFLERPDTPEWAKDPANWPEGLKRELGDDEGKSYNIRHRNEVGAQDRKLRERLDAFNPDFVLIFADDQYENFKNDVIPAFCVQAYNDVTIKPFMPYGDRLNPRGPEAQFGLRQPISDNVWGWPADKEWTIRGHQSGGKYLAAGLINQKIDIAYSYEQLHYETFAHGFLQTMMLLDFDGDKGWPYPTVTFQINCYGSRVIINRGGHYPVGSINMPAEELDPDGPTPERCMEVGAAVARVLKASPWRVAVIASSSWSHAFLVPKNAFLYPDVEADHRMYDALIKGDYETWRKVSNEEVIDRGWQELRNWWVGLGVFEELGHKGPSYSHFIESYSHNSDKVFAIWDPL